MNLYHVQFEGTSYWIEARDFHGAINAWTAHVAKEWGTDFDGTEQPESVALVHDSGVIREPEARTAL